mmetsp:Transcript_25668/g.31618  ORF Transcript_25668/g.31618 Transcript_25668/m.31618 type:complete len:134 (-) Transcript_25668:181-582(-)
MVLKDVILASISARSETGISDPVFPADLPQSLKQNGVSKETWKKFIYGANEAAKFQWGMGSVCCFLCNGHNKSVTTNMRKFCDGPVIQYKLVPSNIRVVHEIKVERRRVNASGGAASGSTLETIHVLKFFKEQ